MTWPGSIERVPPTRSAQDRCGEADHLAGPASGPGLYPWPVYAISISAGKTMVGS